MFLKSKTAGRANGAEGSWFLDCSSAVFVGCVKSCGLTLQEARPEGLNWWKQ